MIPWIRKPVRTGDAADAEGLIRRAANVMADAGGIASKELYSDSKASVGKSLAIDHAREGSEFAAERTKQQPLVQFFGSLRQKARTKRADVFGGGTFGGRRVVQAENFDRKRQPSSFFNPSGPHRHV